jgi:hypothetical protein
MQTLKLVYSDCPGTYYHIGDIVRLSKLGACKVLEASRTVLTVLDALGQLYEVTATPEHQNTLKQPLNRAKS